MARGSIVKRPSGYTLVYDVGFKWDEKKEEWVRNQKWEKVPHPNNKKHAETLLAQRLAEIDRGDFVEPSKMLLAEFIELWKQMYAVPEVDPSTLARYESNFRAQIIPKLGHLEMGKARVDDIQEFKARLTEEGLSPGYIKHLLALLRQMFDHAIDWGKCRNNPAKKVRYPKISRTEAEFWEPHEVRAFFESLQEEYAGKPIDYAKWNAFFLVGITGCLRIGELFAVRWANLDWETGRYYVKETWKRPRGKGSSYSIGSPKTGSSIAPVNLSPMTMDALRVWQRRQAEEKLEVGENYQGQGLVFTNAIGLPLDYWNFCKRVFGPVMKRKKIREIGTHSALRHTGAAMMIDNNENVKYIQKQLRHASIKMTFDVYGHLFQDSHNDAPSRMDNIVFGGQKEVATAV